MIEKAAATDEEKAARTKFDETMKARAAAVGGQSVDPEADE